jgi:2-keto-4-pentenoate hydratase
MSSPGAVARALHEAGRTGVPIQPPTDAIPDLSIADAYAIQRAGLRLRGADVVGHKVGLTSAAMQEMLGVDQPDFGYLTEDMLSPSGAALVAGRFIAPRVEGEIAFRLGRPLRGAGLGVADVLAATEAVAPALEVIDSRVADWRITIGDTIADNASCGHVVVGEWQPLGDLPLEAVEMELVVEAPDGRQTVEGVGAAVLGHPAEAVAWLAAALHEHGGERLEAREVVLPGAMARAVPVGAGCSVRASMGSLGSVTVRFE